MKFLLPHSFKRAGVWMAPLGFLVWLLMQRDVVTDVLTAVFGPDNPPPHYPPYFRTNVAVAVVSFLSFLAGMYFVSFSKEKIEDELVQRIRLESFQFAALTQLVSIIAFMIFFCFVAPRNDDIFMVFFLAELFLFWICYIFRFQIALWRR